MRILSIKDRFKLVVYALGVFICYFIFGIFQQKVFDEKSYGEKFEYATPFVVLQCLVYSVVAKVVTLTHDHQKNETPHKYYIFAAIFYFLAGLSSNKSLQYIEYVAQVVGKSCKPIAVMVFGVFLARKSYRIQKYLFVLMIVAGVGLFLYKTDHKENKNAKPLIGNLLIGASLLCDGLLGAVQDKTRNIASMRPSALNFMFFINIYSVLIGFPFLFINWEIVDFVKFCMRHNWVILDMAAVIACGTFGQFFITAMLSEFGSLPLSIVTTIRKFCTAVFSALFIKQVLSSRQWIATGIIFAALFLDVFFGKKNLCKREEDEESSDRKEESESAVKISV